MKKEDVKQYVKEHKKGVILTGVGGILLFAAGVMVYKHCSNGNVINFSHICNNQLTDTKITHSFAENCTKLWREIDEEVFTEIAPEIENTLIDNTMTGITIDRNWEVAEGVIKRLVVNVETIEN